MSIIDTLITDRTAADTSALEALFAKAKAGSLTEEERAILADPAHKGTYNYTDLNRVSAALEYLRSRLNGYGYTVKGYDRLKVPHTGAVQLPEGYTQVEYIRSSGTQNIDTGVYLDFSQDVEVEISFETSTDKSRYSLINSFYASGVDSWGFEVFTDNRLRLYWNMGAVSVLAGSVSAGTKHTARFEWVASTQTYRMYLDGEQLATNTYAYSGKTPYAVRVFQDNRANSGSTFSAPLSVYSLSMKNGTAQKNFVSCLNPDGEYGLYDVANSKFHGNAGSGVFTGGPELKEESKDPYLWYESDIPAAAEMTRYLQNVSAIRAVLAALPTTPSVPADMEVLTAAEANAIEVILMDVETLINNMIAAWLFCGDVYSGEV